MRHELSYVYFASASLILVLALSASFGWIEIPLIGVLAVLALIQFVALENLRSKLRGSSCSTYRC